jgi:putative heme-binding domain-containing protein
MSRHAAALALLALIAAPLAAAEKWADPRLKTTDGLALWLDAGRQSAAWRANGKPTPQAGAALDVWYDASGNGLHLVQRSRPQQPRFFPLGRLAVVRFDGQDDCLNLSGLKRTLKECSLFIVAVPRSNAGGFRALFALNETGKNDYLTGLNLDLTGDASVMFDRVNVEGFGFGGAVNLLKAGQPFGSKRILEVRCAPGPEGVQLFLDGQAAGRRKREPGTLRMDDVTLGARFYSNTPDPPQLTGFYDGDVAEVLLYDRLLSEEESKGVAAYLRDKYAALDADLAAAFPKMGQPLRPVADPPPVQLFVPGFTVRQLPVELTNINNVRYRADGKLVALAYDGNIYLLSDSDGDGLEDKVELFWENKGRLRAPIGMALTPPGYKHGDGVFVASKGKLSLIVDTKKSGKADREIVVAEGWKELPHGVDALGVALDGDGNIYFGLGAADYTNPYQIDKDGKAHYDLKSERGTILKASPDFTKREIVATGVRFSVGLAFNRKGDLFATDQEGATWLANGNPLDELLHIQPGRHYGFPPRHPKHLPNVIDEPSVFDYGPQHQSTCGLAFNDPVNGGSIFGPASWDGDAFLTGYSRGKLYRTQLVATPVGYVARNQLLACLNMLAVDACVSPKGDLVVAVHSGAPDWGSGPNGKGKLYQIRYSDKDAPQPLFAWAAGSQEVRIAFDRPLDPLRLKDLARRTTIEYGKYVRPGDRFESLRPGYAVVGQQLAAPRFGLPVLGAQVSADRRTLVLLTGPQAEAVSYAVTLPRQTPAEKPRKAAGELPQTEQIDLGYDLGGVAALWESADGKARWEGWLPHLDLGVSRTLTAGGAEHDLLWKRLSEAGKLKLQCKLDLWQLLRPAVQPGSTIDYTLPPEQVVVTLKSSGPFTAKAAGGPVQTADKKKDRFHLEIKLNPKEGDPTPLDVELTTGPGKALLEMSYFTQEDDRPRALPPGRVLLPWASRQAASTNGPREIPELKGGSWARGREVFFSDQALCSRCHRVGGQGGRIGPDLSNLRQRDYASVLRDIREPSAAINPDHIAYVVELKDGKTLTGVLRTEDGKLILGDDKGKETVLEKERIESLRPSPLSIMPEGIDKTLGPDKMRDLLTFLLTEPLKPAPLERDGAPPPRTRAEVEAILKGSTTPARPLRPLNVVLTAGKKDHGPGEHDYPLWQRRWMKLLELAENVTVSEADQWPTAAQLEKADLIVFYSSNPAWTEDRAKELDAYLKRGGGLVFLHYAVYGRKAVDALSDRIGLAWKDGQSRYRHGPLELSFPDKKHPLARNFDKVKFEDESYWKLAGDPKAVAVVATGEEDGAAQPLLWTRQQGKGRVFVSIPGHYTWTFDDPLYRVLILRGLAWAAGEPVDRFNPLVLEGARLKEE